ncbi:hypothetical protein EXN66_Car002122 [Channa argus]|uniref:Uncharacterized protein n=1 Tax=Channa argus TaxID=215402 RepID=A0A6G1P826_CHAAH|nr:hypothetical protein EXN66_Car002122 [Channa argus]
MDQSCLLAGASHQKCHKTEQVYKGRVIEDWATLRITSYKYDALYSISVSCS